MRVLVCGDRNWTDFKRIYDVLREMDAKSGITCVIEGEARGADTMARHAAMKLNIPVLRYPANWEKHGRAAGPIRNKQMLIQGNPDVVIGFHNDILKSKGTRHMLDIAKQAGKHVLLAKEYGKVEGY